MVNMNNVHTRGKIGEKFRVKSKAAASLARFAKAENFRVRQNKQMARGIKKTSGQCKG